MITRSKEPPAFPQVASKLKRLLQSEKELRSQVASLTAQLKVHRDFKALEANPQAIVVELFRQVFLEASSLLVNCSRHSKVLRSVEFISRSAKTIHTKLASALEKSLESQTANKELDLLQQIQQLRSQNEELRRRSVGRRDQEERKSISNEVVELREENGMLRQLLQQKRRLQRLCEEQLAQKARLLRTQADQLRKSQSLLNQLGEYISELD